MPSTTRGSILISTANDIGEALVDKLGGVGYSPNEWKDKFNLCGIAPVDSAPALSVLSDSAGTGDERGSILIATADAIGAILNKKYNVLRGFKPKEWASACRKMKALEEGSVASASIASFSDGADTVPLTSCVCDIDANLDGKSAVNAVHARKNLADNANFTHGLPSTTIGASIETISASTRYAYFDIDIKGGIFTASSISNDTTYYNLVIIWGYTNGILSYYGNVAANASKTVDLSICDHVRVGIGSSAGAYIVPTNLDGYGTLQIEVGSTATTYEPYQTPETKTADLGRAVYGGSADIITGEGSETHKEYTLDNLTWSGGIVGGAGWCWYVDLSADGLKLPANSEIFSGLCNNYTPIRYNGVATTQNTIALHSNGYLYVNNGSETTEPTGKVTIELATPTNFTFEPVKIDSFPGVNNIWNDCGNTAVEYYKAPTPYTRKTATGGIANFSDQRTDLPLTKAIANIAPSIAGKSAVNLYQGKKNLLNANDSSYTFQVGDNYRYNCGTVSLKKGVTYTFSALQEDALTSNTRNTLAIGVNEVYTYESATGTNYHNQSGVHSMQYTPSEDCEAVFLVWVHTPSNAVKYSDFMLEVGSSASAYVPYQAPTTYTAELGETVYGGSADFVSGEVVKKQDITTLTNDGWTYYATGGKNTFNKIISGAEAGEIGLLDGYTFEQVSYTSQQSDKCFYFYASGANVRISVRDDEYTSAEEFAEHMNGENLVYTLATPTESAIPGRVISPIDGVNNYWNDAGGDTEIQYFENET